MKNIQLIQTETSDNLDLNIIEGSAHTYVGYEEKVAELVVNFLN